MRNSLILTTVARTKPIYAQKLVTVLAALASLLSVSSLAHIHHDHHGVNLDNMDTEEIDFSDSVEQLLSDPRLVALEADGEIASRMKLFRLDRSNWRNLNQLGWLIARHARVHQNESFYSLSERLAAVNLDLNGRRPETLSLWIHSLLQEHRFAEARIGADELVEIRGEGQDHALRGDAAMEQGDLFEARDDYREFLNRSPSLPAYARWGHLNWLLGEEDMAIGAWKEAIELGRGTNNESLAWCKVKLAEIYLNSGELEKAKQWVEEALKWNPDYAIGRFMEGRIDWFQGSKKEAVESIEIAASIDPLPERLWWLEDVHRSLGNRGRAGELRERIIEYGSTMDPRSTSLYLSTRGIGTKAALDMAKAEQRNRADASTLDALGYCWLRMGELDRAESALADSSAKGRVPGRRSLHQGMLAWEKGQAAVALEFWNRAYQARFAMTPSEIEVLKTYLAKANATISETEKLFAQGRLENE